MLWCFGVYYTHIASHSHFTIEEIAVNLPTDVQCEKPLGPTGARRHNPPSLSLVLFSQVQRPGGAGPLRRGRRNARRAGHDSGCTQGPLGPLGSSSSQHRRTLELILQEGSAFFKHQTQGPQGLALPHLLWSHNSVHFHARSPRICAHKREIALRSPQMMTPDYVRQGWKVCFHSTRGFTLLCSPHALANAASSELPQTNSTRTLGRTSWKLSLTQRFRPRSPRKRQVRRQHVPRRGACVPNGRKLETWALERARVPITALSPSHSFSLSLSLSLSNM